MNDPNAMLDMPIAANVEALPFRTPRLKLSEDQRKRIAQRICLELRQSDEAKRELEDMWDDHEHMYQADSEAASPEIVEGMGGYSLPLWKPITDRIVSHGYNSFFGQRPTVQCIDLSGKARNVDKLERTLDNLADKAGLELEYKRALRSACNTNLGTVCVWPVANKDAKVVGIRAKYQNPKRIYAYPSDVDSYADAKTVGYFYTELYYRVRRKQKQGEFFDCKILTGADANEGRPGIADSEAMPFVSASVADERVKIAVVQTEMDLSEFTSDGKGGLETDGTGYERYVAYVAVDSEELLSIEKLGSTDPVSGDFLEYDLCSQVEVKLQPEEEDGLFNKCSIAYSMKGLQDLFSDNFTTFQQGNQLAAFGVIAITGDTGGKKIEVVRPGDVIILPAGCKVDNIFQPFNGAGLLQANEIISSFADRITGVGGLGSGEETHGATATEVDQLAAAIQSAKDMYTQGLAGSVEKIYDLILMYLRHHYWDLVDAYGPLIEIGYEELMSLNVRLEVTGRTGASNPSLTLRKLYAVLNFAVQNPMLGIDTRKLVIHLLSTMDLPFSVESVMLAPEDMLVVATQNLSPMELEVAKLIARAHGPGGANAQAQEQQRGPQGPVPLRNGGQPGMGQAPQVPSGAAGVPGEQPNQLGL